MSGSLRCQVLGCRWENRRGYDWCDRCESVSWHVVQAPQRRRLALPSLLALLALPVAALGWAGAHEGSDLFVDDPG